MKNDDIMVHLEEVMKSSAALSLAVQQSAKPDKLSEDDKKRAAYALNMCTVSVSQIVDYADLNILEQEYDAILNNLNLEQIPKKDDALLHILKVLLDTITFFRIQEGDKKLVEKKYQQKMKNAIWNAIPNFGLVVAGGNPITMAISLASQVGIGYMNYRRAKAENDLEYEDMMWQLQRSAIEQFNGIRRELFDTTWRLAATYKFPDKYRLTEKQIKQYNAILMDPDEIRKFERLESIQDKFEAYPPFWYFIGHSAHFISRDNSLAENTRKKYLEKALFYFEKYDDLSKYNILREDQLASACALEHADILMLNPDYDKTRVRGLINKAVQMCGSAFDIMQLCAISYLKIGAQEDASRFLKILVNEGYNQVVNAQLLSSIYVHNRDISAYEVLSTRVDPEYLFPMPQSDAENMEQLEANFEKLQKEILINKFKAVFECIIRNYSIKWNKITSIFDVTNTYDESFFEDTPAAQRERMLQAKRIFQNEPKRESYLQYIANCGYELEMLGILNKTKKSVFSLRCFADANLEEEFSRIIKTNLWNERNTINDIQNSMVSKKFSEDEYRRSQSISYTKIVKTAFTKLIEYSTVIIQDATLSNISRMESDLRDFCLSEGIPEPEAALVSAAGNTLSPSMGDTEDFGPELFGQHAIIANQTAKFIKEMASFAKKSMTEIPLTNNDVSIYYRDEDTFNGYFYSETFNAHSDLKSYSIMVIKDNTKTKFDLIFTTQGIVNVVNGKVKTRTPYKEVTISGNSIVLYPNRKYHSTAFDTNAILSLIRKLGTKFVKRNENIIEHIDGTVSVTELNKWFRNQPAALEDGVGMVYAIPSTQNLNSVGIFFDEDISEDNCLLQYFYSLNSGEILGIRIVYFDNIESNFQAKLTEHGGIIRVGK